MSWTEKPEENLTKEGYGLFRAYTYLKNYNIWPNNGGLMRQSSKFIAAIDVIDGIKSKYDLFDAEEQRMKDKMNAMKAK